MKQRILLLAIASIGTIMGAESIFDAIQEGNMKRVKQMVKENPDILQKENRDNFKPIHEAARHDAAMVKLLLKHGANPNERSSAPGKPTPLHIIPDGIRSNYISEQEGIKIARALIKSGADVNAQAGGITPLFVATMGNYIKLAEVLLKNGADPRIQVPPHLNIVQKSPNVTGNMTPLFMAALKGHKEMVQLLLKHGARASLDIKVKGKTPIEIAQENGHSEIVTILKNAQKRG